MYLTDGAGIFCNFVKTLKSSNLRSKFLKAFAMKRVYIFLVSALLISLYSCSTYRNTQTPDDVYYSPGVPATQAASAQTNNSDYYSTPNDNYVRMRVTDPNRGSYFDDYGSVYYEINYGYGYGYGSGVGLSFGFGSGFY